jgi:G:T-mismatch repair DNA endonuclease (very short patch repair protein)
MSEKSEKSKDFNLYEEKKKILKDKRVLRNKIIGNDTVDGSTFQRHYGELTKTRRALKIEFFGSKSKASGTDGKDTSIEVFVENLLTELGVDFKKQKAIRYINVDFFVKDRNLAIEVCGDYWHVNSRVYETPKNNIQKKNLEKDRLSKEVLKKAKVHRLEIWELDIKKSPEIVRQKLKEVLESTDFESEELLDLSSHDWTKGKE